MPRTRRSRPAAPMLATPLEPTTAAQLLTYRDPADRRTELVRGRLLVSEPPGYEHGLIVTRIAVELSLYVRATPLPDGTPIGEVVSGDPGFWIARDPDTVRAPDVAFVAAEWLPATRERGFLDHAPTLAVEVISPDDRPGAVLAKVAQWIEGGSALVWTIDPGLRLAHVYRADGTQGTVDAMGILEGEEVLPGFALPLVTLLR